MPGPDKFITIVHKKDKAQHQLQCMQRECQLSDKCLVWGASRYEKPKDSGDREDSERMGFSFLWYSEEAEVQRGHPTHGRTARIRDSHEMFNLEVVILIY